MPLETKILIDGITGGLALTIGYILILVIITAIVNHKNKK
jgi:hypothetical protein